MRPTVLYHATGGGLGHAVRSLSLARQLRRLVGGRHVLLLNTPFASALRAEPGVEMIVTASQATAQEVAGLVARTIESARPDLFVVDTFPRGVGGELVRLLEGWSACPRILIGRGLPPAYVERFRLREFVRRHFDFVCVPGEPSPWDDLDNAARFNPFLIRDLNELPSPAAACRLLRSPTPVVLLAGSGSPAECGEWVESIRELAGTWPADAPPLRLALPEGIPAPDDLAGRIVRHFPLMDCLPGVKLLVASAGYNLVHEARATRTRGLFVARKRLYDDQGGRGQEARPTCETILHLLATPTAPLPPIGNGADDAARHIATILSRRPLESRS